MRSGSPSRGRFEGRNLAERTTFWDGLLFAFLVAVTAASLLASRSGPEGKEIEVRVGEQRLRFPLSVDSVHALQGPLGEAQLVVKEGRAILRNASCPMRICEAMGAASRPGDLIVCVPNRIVVSVVGERELDAVSR